MATMDGWLKRVLQRLLPKPLPRREGDDDNFTDPCYWV